MAQALYYPRLTWPALTFGQVEQAARGELAIYWSAHGKPHERLEYRLKPKEWQEYERAKRRGYLVVKGRRSNLPNVWFGWCEAVQHPYIKAILDECCAEVEMDLSGQRWKLTDASVRAIYAWAEELPWRASSPAERGVGVIGGNTAIVFQGVAREYAGCVAEMLLMEAQRSRSTVLRAAV